VFLSKFLSDAVDVMNEVDEHCWPIGRPWVAVKYDINLFYTITCYHQRVTQHHCDNQVTCWSVRWCVTCLKWGTHSQIPILPNNLLVEIIRLIICRHGAWGNPKIVKDAVGCLCSDDAVQVGDIRHFPQLGAKVHYQILHTG
jgi:hypothetical protein